jgi:hypothetical protein
MKALLLLLLIPLAAHAEKSRFTTVYLDDAGIVYVGVKHGGDKGLSEIITFPFDSGNRTSIPLPAEITERDVIGLITEKHKLFVVTNHIGAADDGPTVHVYDRDHNKWTKVGHVVCPVFTRVTLSPTHMIFSCEAGKRGRKGKTVIARKTISFKKDRIYNRSGSLIFPEFMLHFHGRTVMLEGEAPSWDTLRLRSDSGERTISADSLAQLPLPPTPPLPPEPIPDETPSQK